MKRILYQGSTRGKTTWYPAYKLILEDSNNHTVTMPERETYPSYNIFNVEDREQHLPPALKLNTTRRGTDRYANGIRPGDPPSPAQKANIYH